ncbi:MAG: hypothetical protein JWP87_4494 [Labilithrix sp.]|nr:hypothetical protein [Labilithrix sp.]
MNAERSAAVIELHPEELLDLEATGLISASARSALDAHCGRCAACRYERRMRVYFADALEDRAIALERAEPRLETKTLQISPSSRSLRGIAAGCALIVAAFALGSAATRRDSVPVPRESRSVEPTPTARDAHALRGRRMPPGRERVAITRAPTAAMLFDAANRARVRGDYDRALSTYRRLQRLHPRSRETSVSYVVMGRMQLDRADAVGALQTFERYEAFGNLDLDAVVMAGRALALDSVGSESSSEAWAALLESYPDTPYAQHARLRVAATTSL